jgi:hypothetical protein
LQREKKEGMTTSSASTTTVGATADGSETTQTHVRAKNENFVAIILSTMIVLLMLWTSIIIIWSNSSNNAQKNRHAYDMASILATPCPAPPVYLQTNCTEDWYAVINQAANGKWVPFTFDSHEIQKAWRAMHNDNDDEEFNQRWRALLHTPMPLGVWGTVDPKTGDLARIVNTHFIVCCCFVFTMMCVGTAVFGLMSKPEHRRTLVDRSWQGVLSKQRKAVVSLSADNDTSRVFVPGVILHPSGQLVMASTSALLASGIMTRSTKAGDVLSARDRTTDSYVKATLLGWTDTVTFLRLPWLSNSDTRAYGFVETTSARVICSDDTAYDACLAVGTCKGTPETDVYVANNAHDGAVIFAGANADQFVGIVVERTTPTTADGSYSTISIDAKLLQEAGVLPTVKTTVESSTRTYWNLSMMVCSVVFILWTLFVVVATTILGRAFSSMPTICWLWYLSISLSVAGSAFSAFYDVIQANIRRELWFLN